MSGFLRAFQGELYLLSHRSSVRRAHLLVVVVAVLHVLGSMWLLQAEARLDDIRADTLAAWNFWPRWAAGSRAAMYFVELLVLALIAGSFPREISGGVVRDPAVHAEVCATIADWLAAKNVPADKAREFSGAVFYALAATAKNAPEHSFADLTRESATRGGTNEQVLAHLKEDGAYRALSKAMDGIWQRFEDAKS